MDPEVSNQISHSSNHSTSPLIKSFYEVLLMSIAYSSIFILALFGNIMVILSVSRRPGMQSVMHIFICNLSIADILASICVLPITLLQNIFEEWLFGLWTCKSATYLQGTTICASVTTLATIALDRYLAICYPLKRFLNRHRAKWIIAGIWIFSCTLTSPWAIYFDTHVTEILVDNVTKRNITVCTDLWPNQQLQKAYFIGIMVTTLYVLPLCLICYFYCTIAVRVLSRFHGVPSDEKTSRTGKDQAAASNGQGGRRGLNGHVVMRSTGGISKAKTINIVKMLATVVAVFAFSWLPFYVIATTIALTSSPDISDLLKPLAFSQWLGASNYCVNPWIYCFYSKKYRESFKAILLCRWRSSRRHYRPFILESTVARSRVLKQENCDSAFMPSGSASAPSCNPVSPFSRETCL